MPVDWKQGDRVRVLHGEYAGRTGTVNVLSSSPYAALLKIADGHVQVALDGESGTQTMGGRGGIPIVISVDDLCEEAIDETRR